MPANHSDISHAMLVKNRVRDFCKHLYQLCIVPVPKQDYEKYYTGIANGLFWPAFHHLPEYIAQDYEDQVVLFDHWYAYMRVSFYFSVDALRKCNNVDFVWVHDYHLMLVAMIIRMYNPKIDTGFFLHIPFNPPKDFFVKYHPVATIILRALLSFRKLGFQTVRDAKRFIGYVQERLSGAVVVENTLTEKWYVEFQGIKCSIGVFPVSVKTDDFSCLPFFQSAVQEQVNKVYKRICEVANAQVHCVAVPQQDCYGSIPMRDCNRWFSRVKETIAEIGDLPNHCEVQDDGTHISIRTKQAALERAFTKADGIAVYHA